MTTIRRLKWFFALLWREDFLGGRISARTAWRVACNFADYRKVQP